MFMLQLKLQMRVHNPLNVFIVLSVFVTSVQLTDIKTLECQFTDGLCNWSNDTKTWKIGNFDDVAFGRPVHPVSGGGYIYGSNIFNQIISPTLDENVESFCLSFNYYMFGTNVGQLSLRLIEDDGSGNQWIEVDEDVWIRQGSQVDDWFTGRYHFVPSKNSKVKIAFVATSSDIALGPIKVNPDSCDYNNLCNFEDLSVCFWLIEPDYRSNYAWYVSDGKSSGVHLTYQDTTTRSELGKFLRTPDDGLQDSKSILTTSVQLNSFEAKCLSFNLFKPNEDSDLVEVSFLVNNQSESKYIWTSASVKANSRWQPVKINLAEVEDFTILITAEKHSNEDYTAVAIDDLQVDPRPCSNLIDCSFDDTNCVISVISGPLLVGFGRLSNAEALNFTMDSYKNDDPDDFFIYTDTPTTNQTVIYQFITPAVATASDIACFSFSYFMEPIDLFANYLFEVNLQPAAGYNLVNYEPRVTFAKWTKVEYVLSASELSQIQFSLTTESKLFAAFDDIKLYEGVCGEQAQQQTITPTSQIYLENSFNDSLSWNFWQNWAIKYYNSSNSPFPLADPFGDVTGSFVSLTSSKGEVKTAILESPEYDSGFYCLSLWFWCDSNEYSRLYVTLLSNFSDSSRSTPIFNELCNNPSHWKLLETTYNTEGAYSLQIVGETTSGVIVLDELTIFNGSCNHEQVIDETCSFDDGTDCGIDIVTSPFYNWRIEQGSQLSQPMVDKSTNTFNGHVLSLDLSPTPKINSTSYFFLADLKSEASYCISFSYFIQGDCNLAIWKTRRNNIDTLSDFLITYDDKFGSSWFKVLLQIDSVLQETDIVFGGTYPSGSSGLIALDDLSVSLGECISVSSCDFTSECDWVSLPMGTSLPVDGLEISYDVSALWEMGTQASTAKTYGYPRKDHTLTSAEGYYGFTANTRNKKAILASPVIYLGDNENICLKLTYVVEIGGNIEVLVEQRENSAYVFKNLHGDGDGLRTWQEAQIDIPLRPSPTRMVRVYLVSSPDGLSAIDDVSVTQESCPMVSETFFCSDGSKIPQTSRCDYKKDCSDGSDEQSCGACEFDSSACDYFFTGQTTWTVKNSYIALDKSKIGVNIQGALVSPVIQETSASCKINFRYAKHVSDDLMVSLSLSANEIQIWDSSMTEQNLDWNLVTIQLGRIRTPFRVIFTGTTTFRLFEYQQVSIDYIRFDDCGFNNSSEPRTAEVFVCSDGLTIGLDKVCDSEWDCIKGEDEDNCNNQVYSFEHGQLYPWVSDAWDDNSVRWTVTSGVGIISEKPTLDHTRRLPSGSYAFLSSEKFTTNNESRTLTGPKLNATTDCTIGFYYYLSSENFKLYVFITNLNSTVSLAKIEDPSDFGFKHFTVNLNAYAIQPPFQVLISGTASDQKASASYVALDDISFSPSCYGQTSTGKLYPTPEPESESDLVEQPCNTNEFYCEVDNKCITIEETCNYINDCSDGADEKYCGSCDFNDNLCGWINEGTNLWVPMNRSFAEQEGWSSELANPASFLVATGSPTGGSVAIRSPLLGKTSPVCVFNFKYHLSGQTKLSIRIKQDNSLVSKTIEELAHHSSGSSQWIDGQLGLTSLEYNHYVQFVLDTPPADQFFLTTGLANFNLLYCDPDKVNFAAFDCNFDDDSCGWTDAGSKGLSWSLITNSSFVNSNKFGFGEYSNQDHPSFVNLNVSPTHSAHSVRTLTSPWQYATGVFCFSFDYRLLAFDETSFRLVIETPGNILRTLFMKEGEPNYGWNRARVTIKDVYEFRLIFTVETGLNANETVISIDNLQLSSDSCAFHQASCDFSVGTCDWINQGWTTVQRQQVASADGQYREYYLRNYGDRKSTLTLMGFGDEEAYKCLSFWYYHTFNVTSDLTITSIKGDSVISTEVVPAHEIANTWSYYRTSILIGEDTSVFIEAGPLGVFDTTGLDDITLYGKPCDYPGNCDFEYDSCGWQNKNLVKWRRNLGVTPSTDNHLADQINFNDRGLFLFVRVGELVHGNSATLESTRLTLTSPVCISFKYLFTSGQANETKLTLKTVDTANDATQIIDYLIDDGTIRWTSYEKTVKAGFEFKILIIASATVDGAGDIALDDIHFASGKCENDKETTTTTPSPTTVTQKSPATLVPVTQLSPEPQPEPITPPPPPPISIADDDISNSLVNRAASFLTANSIFSLIKQHAYIIVGILVLACMLLLPMAFVVRNLIQPSKSYQPDTSVEMDNRVYDIVLGTVQNVTSEEVYEEVDALSSSAKFEMTTISESEAL